MEITCPHCKKKIEIPSKKELKQQALQAVLASIPTHKNIRWKELKQKSRLSSRTLSTKLKELESDGKIMRIVDESVYPPAVSYQRRNR